MNRRRFFALPLAAAPLAAAASIQPEAAKPKPAPDDLCEGLIVLSALPGGRILATKQISLRQRSAGGSVFFESVERTPVVFTSVYSGEVRMEFVLKLPGLPDFRIPWGDRWMNQQDTLTITPPSPVARLG